jgi:hypothetical protein
LALELNKLTGQVEEMGQALARRQQEQAELGREAQGALASHAMVTAELRERLNRARREDATWRGADPIGDRLDERHVLLSAPPPCATLIAADGSQIYPDRHGIAPYYLVNRGSIVVRAGTGQPPDVATQPLVYYSDTDLYDELGHVRDREYVNRQRDRLEIEALSSLAQAEHSTNAPNGGAEAAFEAPAVAMLDGPLLLWAPEQTRSRSEQRLIDDQLREFTDHLEAMHRVQTVPIGYVDRPGSAFVLRTLELASLEGEQISREQLRHGRYRRITDRALFSTLEPNERSGLFASTSRTNDRYRDRGQRILFFYVNVARQAGARHAAIARVEFTEWAAQPALLDTVQQIVYADCALHGYPYVLARAHELAVVGNAERANFEAMLQQSMLRCGMRPATASGKASLKQVTGSHRRS